MRSSSLKVYSPCLLYTSQFCDRHVLAEVPAVVAVHHDSVRILLQNFGGSAQILQLEGVRVLVEPDAFRVPASASFPYNHPRYTVCLLYTYVVHSGEGFVILGPRQVVWILLSVFFQDPFVDRLLRVPGVLSFTVEAGELSV